MADIAALAISLDSSPLVQGKAALDALSTSATRTATAIDALAAPTAATASANTRLSVTGVSVAGTLDREAASASRAASAMNTASVAAARLAANTNHLSGQTGNIAAQFQDIGVQLAGGQSPFLIALQQGTQLSAVLGTVQGGARGVGGALAAAFGSILSPVSLATIGIIALGGAAIQYFTSVGDDGEKANATLKKHNDQIRAVADEWGVAVPALKAYADEIDRMQKVTELQTVGAQKTAEALAALNASFDEFVTNNDEVVTAINLAYDAQGKSDTSLSKLATGWESLSAHIKDGTATQDEFTNVSKLLQAAVKESDGQLDSFASGFDTLSGRIVNSLTVLQQFQQQMKDALITGMAVQQQIQNMTTGQINNPNLPDNRFALPINGPTPDKRPNIELEGIPDQQKKLKDATGNATNEINKQAEAYRKLTETQSEQAQNLQLEANLIGASVSERNRQTAALQAEQQLRRNGIDLLSKEGQAYKQNAVAQADAKTQIEARAAAVKSWQDAETGAVDSIIDGISTVNNDWKSTFVGILQDVEKFVLTLTVGNPIKNWLTGSNLPTMSDLFSGKTTVPGSTATTGTMTVTAASVMVNGGVTGGLGNVPLTPGATTTLSSYLGLGAAKTNGVRPDLTASGLVNAPAAANALTSAVNTPSNMVAYQNAIKSIESGGKYDITGPVLKSGDRAYGAYQVMGNNIPSWSEKWTGTRMTPQQYLADPAAQDKVFNGEFGSYVDKYGASGAASKWFTGSAIPTGKKDVLGTSDNSYVKQFNAALEKTTPNVSTLGDTSSKTATAITDSLGKIAQPGALPAATAIAPSGGGSVGGIGSIFSSLFSLFGFASGGYTGPGSKNQVAGFAHKGEYVFDAASTRNIGIGNLESMRRGYSPARRENIPAARNDNRNSSIKGEIKASIRYVDNGKFAAHIDSIKQEAVTEAEARSDAKMSAYDREHLPVRVQQISNNTYGRG